MFASSAGFPFAPVGGMDVDRFPSTSVDPHAIPVAAAECNGMDSGFVDDGDFQIAFSWNAEDLLPLHENIYDMLPMTSLDLNQGARPGARRPGGTEKVFVLSS